MINDTRTVSSAYIPEGADGQQALDEGTSGHGDGPCVRRQRLGCASVAGQEAGHQRVHFELGLLPGPTQRDRKY